MIRPEAFDAFYKDARARLMLQTYALTGDLPAARSAVRDSFIVTWHHWRKVSRLPDPEAWVRPHAWAQAHRRHTARLWHRDKSLAPEAKATLAALGELSLTQRKALVLARTTSLDDADRARELGLPLLEAQRQTTTALERFLAAREVSEEQVDGLFDQLALLAGGSRLPRATILRRAGAARRRTHTLLGAAATVGAVVLSGTLVSGMGAADTTASTLSGSPQVRGGQADVPSPEDQLLTAFTSDRLLEARDVAQVVDGRRWHETETGDNSEGSGRVAPCQQERYAAPNGRAALVRSFETGRRRGQSPASVTQYAELSAGGRDSHRAWQRMLRWYGGCVTPRMQLIDTHTVTGVGEAAMLFHLRSWRGSGETYLVGVARTGPLVTTTVTSTAEPAASLKPSARLLGRAVDGLCTAAPDVPCATTPRLREAAPVRVGETPGLLVEADLPPVRGISKPWVGTEPRRARTNSAATGCDQTDFSQKQIDNAVTRTFLVPHAKVPAAFGITETVGVMRPDRARAFVADVRKRMSSCSERDPGTEVTGLTSASSRDHDLALWRVTSELNDRQTVTFLMGIARVGGTVGQVGFVPGQGIEMEPGAFDALVRRAKARLPHLPTT